jgi:hypothetical protein
MISPDKPRDGISLARVTDGSRTRLWEYIQKVTRQNLSLARFRKLRKRQPDRAEVSFYHKSILLLAPYARMYAA